MPKRKQDLSEQLSNWHKIWLACKAPQHIPIQRRFNQNYWVPLTSAFLESCATQLSGRELPSYKQLPFHIQERADVRSHQDHSCCVYILSVCLHLLFWRNSCVAVSSPPWLCSLQLLMLENILGASQIRYGSEKVYCLQHIKYKADQPSGKYR